MIKTSITIENGQNCLELDWTTCLCEKNWLSLFDQMIKTTSWHGNTNFIIFCKII
jgi:hypothetical protein